MSGCEKCGKIFRDRCDLGRHQSRSRPCTEVCRENGAGTMEENSQKPHFQTPKPHFQTPKPHFLNHQIKKTTLILDTNIKNSCQYCFNIFSTEKYKTRHEQICKQQNDPIRLLELEQDICPILPECKTECRFCNKIYCKINVLNIHLTTCKKRKEYHKLLKLNKNKEDKCTINNITTNTVNNINNGTVNNIHINVLGQENTDHIETENIINLLRDIRKEFGENQASLMAGTFIDSFDKYIRENPENLNIIIPHHKSTFGTIQTEQGWKKMSTDRCLNRAFKSSANELYTHKEAINNHNELVFKSLTNKQIFSEVKQFGITGLEGNSDEIRQIKTSFKIGKLKETEIDF